ncbi:MAG: glycosyltransferase family 4 protein [Cyclobacteriaceae bacterium]|nr:glycosyltransferase family 4 protein [Cyclobacteriaceae bacterium]
MNILLITQEDFFAGSTYSVSYLAHALAARGNNVYVAARPNSLLHELIEKYPQVVFLPLTIKSRFDRKAIQLLVKWTHEYNIHVINAQSSKDRYITIFARWFYGIKSRLFHTRRQYPMSVGGYVQRKFYVAGTDKIISISEGLKQIFVKKGFPAAHIKVIHNGMPAARYQQWSETEVDRLRTLYGIKPGEIVVGSISRYKRQEQIIKAMALLNKPEIKIVTAGLDEGYLDSFCKEFNLKNPVIYAGAVKGDSVLNYYKLLTVNILASVSDGFGLVLLEAMAMGTPVIATRFGGITDVVKHDVNGLLFNDGDCETLARHIDMLISNPSLRQRLVEQGYKTAYDEFSIEKTAANYELLFQQHLEQD